MIVTQLEAARKNGRGVLLYIGGQTLAGVVLRFDSQFALLKNQQYSEIMVRIERIDAIASN